MAAARHNAAMESRALHEDVSGGVPLKLWTRGVPVEDEARRQLANAARLPVVFHHVAAMPDVHVGIGATVGAVIPTVKAIIPAAVGVDIGCGMIAARTTLRAEDLPDNLGPLRAAIERAVPHGRVPGARDPGVQSVRAIYNHYKRHGIVTEVMGASFRNTGQILALAGCDLLTISPELMARLQATEAPVPRVLGAASARALALPEVHHDERNFRWALNEDAMATEKLAEGIRAFAADAIKLDKMIAGA